MSEINVEEIMKGIREKIKASGAGTEEPPFDEGPFIAIPRNYGALRQAVENMKSESQVQYYYDEPDGPKKIIKNVIRRGLHFVFFPMMESQNRYNADVLRLMKRHVMINDRKQKELLKRIQKLESENRSLRDELEESRKTQPGSEKNDRSEPSGEGTA